MSDITDSVNLEPGWLNNTLESAKYDRTVSAQQLERLAKLSEELGEVQQIIGKILAHGYEGSHPDYDNVTNRNLLEKEVGHVFFALDLLVSNEDIDADNVEVSSLAKELDFKEGRMFLHHQHKLHG